MQKYRKKVSKVLGNIDAIFKLKKAWGEFSSNHPRFTSFLQTVMTKGAGEGTVIDVSITYPGGETLATNMKVTASDIELFNEIKTLASSMNKNK